MPERKRVLSFFEGRVITGQLSSAISFTVLLEFVHITTDSKRFRLPLSIEESIAIAEQYWQSGNWHRMIPKPTISNWIQPAQPFGFLLQLLAAGG